MKKAVITIAICVDDYSKFTIPTIKAYASKIRADCIVIDKQKLSTIYPHYEKYQIHDLLKVYDRILYLDSDVIVKPDCPDLFELVPENKFGILDEADNNKIYVKFYESILNLSKKYNISLSNWDQKIYYNTGVMVISKIHDWLFLNKPKEEIIDMWYAYEQSYLNMMIISKNVEIYKLNYKFNKMPRFCIDEYCYIVHYAGGDTNDKIQRIKLDLGIQ
jgi:lipopolysaccharide biosynthesis glycosyltransferase